MAILMRRGLSVDFDPTKMRAGEWAVTIDAETNKQVVYMCFGAGIVKRMGTWEDLKSELDPYKEACKAYSDTAKTNADISTNAKNQAVTSANSALQSESNAKRYMEQAFSGTPQGYDKVAEGSRFYNATGTSLSLNTSKGGIRLNEVVGNSVKDDSGIHSAGDMGYIPDLSVLNWQISPNGTFYAENAVANRKTNAKGYCSIYTQDLTETASPSVFSNNKHFVFMQSNLGRLIICDTSCADTASLKTKLSGVPFAYELAYNATADEYTMVVEKAGKNFLDISNFKTATVNGITAVNNGGTITLSGTATANTYVIIKTNFDNFIGTYKLVGNKASNSVFVQYYDGKRVYQDTGNGVQFTTLEHNDVKAIFQIYIPNERVLNNVVINPMITEDLSATYDDFQPYIGKQIFIPLPHPLYGINDVKCKLKLIDGKWYYEKKLNQIDLGTLSTWRIINGVWDARLSYNSYPQAKKIGISTVANVLCDLYTADTYNNILNNVNDMSISVSDGNYVVIRDNNKASLSASEFINAVSGVKFIYELAEPTLVEITDQTALYQLESFKDKTYIDTTDGLATLDIDYGMSDVSATALNGERLGNLAVAMAEKKYNELAVAMISI